MTNGSSRDAGPRQWQGGRPLARRRSLEEVSRTLRDPRLARRPEVTAPGRTESVEVPTVKRRGRSPTTRRMMAAVRLPAARRAAVASRRRPGVGRGRPAWLDPRFLAPSVVVLALAAGLGVAALATSRANTAEASPDREALMRAYPYGVGGSPMPDGTRAPAAGLVTFTLVGREFCGREQGNTECLRYRMAAPGTHPGFAGSMLMRREGVNWRLASFVGPERWGDDRRAILGR